MHDNDQAVNAMVVQYKDAIRSFVRGDTAADEFETVFLRIFKKDRLQVESVEYEILEKLFFSIEDYVANPALRDGPEDLDGDQLRERAKVSYFELYGSL